MKTRRSSHAVDQFVGQRLRQQRELKNISAEELAVALCLPVQMIQRIESGSESIGALSLYEAAQVVDVPVTYFFEGYHDEVSAEESAKVAAGVASVAPAGDTIK